MNPNKVVDQPEHIQGSLQIFSGFSIGVSFASKGGIASPHGGIKRFKMIGIDLLL
jgi:hypothetical protein